jgi:hypothetical protein
MAVIPRCSDTYPLKHGNKGEFDMDFVKGRNESG